MVKPGLHATLEHGAEAALSKPYPVEWREGLVLKGRLRALPELGNMGVEQPETPSLHYWRSQESVPTV